MRVLLRLVLALNFTLLAGCATIFRDHVEVVEVTTSPPGAVVAVGGVVQGRTPILLRFARDSESPWIGVWAEGHEAEYVQLVRAVDGEGVGYLVMDLLLVPVLTGPIGMSIALGVDLAGENLYGFVDHFQHLSLKTASPTYVPPAWTSRAVGEQPPTKARAW